jgi:hypothetical protein
VEYPAGMGVPLKTTDKLVIQIHYNLADPASAGKSDSTTVHLQLANSVDRQIAFLLPDGLLESLSNATPDTLPPGKADAAYSWTHTGSEMGLDGVPSVDLMAVMPHMHGRGIRQSMRIGPAGAPPASRTSRAGTSTARWPCSGSTGSSPGAATESWRRHGIV